MKSFQLIIGFDRVESDMFGGVRNGSVVLTVSEDVKEQVLESFRGSGTNIISVIMPDRVVHLNSKNILYITERELELPMNEASNQTA